MVKETYNKNFGEDCVEWFIIEMNAIKIFKKNYSKNDSELNSVTILESYGENTCWSCEKQFEKEVDVTKTSNLIPDEDCPKTVVKDHCQLTSILRG